MNKWLRRILTTLVLAIAVHFTTIIVLPKIIGNSVKGILLEKGKYPVNSFFYKGLRTMEDKRVRMDNPDTMTSRIVYDISQKPLKIHLTIPESGTLPYWSFALYAQNMANFFVINDLAAIERYSTTQLDIVLTAPSSNYQKTGNEIVIIPPDNQGFGVIRTIIPDRYDPEGMK